MNQFDDECDDHRSMQLLSGLCLAIGEIIEEFDIDDDHNDCDDHNDWDDCDYCDDCAGCAVQLLSRLCLAIGTKALELGGVDIESI